MFGGIEMEQTPSSATLYRRKYRQLVKTNPVVRATYYEERRRYRLRHPESVSRWVRSCYVRRTYPNEDGWFTLEVFKLIAYKWIKGHTPKRPKPKKRLGRQTRTPEEEHQRYLRDRDRIRARQKVRYQQLKERREELQAMSPSRLLRLVGWENL